MQSIPFPPTIDPDFQRQSPGAVWRMHAGCDLDAETHATKITAGEYRPGAGMSYFIEDRLAL